ncbi:hypothetical protein NQ317_017902, partial [Molorchus minor]
APTNNSITANVPDIRIVGGTETDIEHHPWQLALLYFSQHFCGAVEIHPEWALTAAHCLEGVLVENLAVRAGSTTSIRTLDYDYALLELAESISIQTASAVALPEPNAPVPDGSVAVISGWGTLSSEGVVPEILQVVEVPVTGCFCAGDIVNGGKDACRGDAGGPVVVSGRLAGLISWGFGCGQAQFPGVHARLSVVLVPLQQTPVVQTHHFPESRIVGGHETDIDHNPWQLALLYHGRHYCGAVEIHPQWALTTARCLEGVLIENLSVRAGSTTKSFGGQVIDVREIHIHPEFHRLTIDYDYGLMGLAQPISVQTASPVAMPEPQAPVPTGAIAVITGWGSLSPDGVYPETLQLVELPVVDHQLCDRLHWTNYEITDRMFCTGDLINGGRDPCQGDTGGPVLVEGRLVGLVSWGYGCADAQRPSVNSRVSAVLGWIYDTSGI